MEPNQAIEVLIQVALLAQKGGVLSLQDAATVLTAIESLKPKQEQPEVEDEQPSPEPKLQKVKK